MGFFCKPLHFRITYYAAISKTLYYELYRINVYMKLLPKLVRKKSSEKKGHELSLQDE